MARRSSIDGMVRKNPLPAGRYWIDIIRKSDDIWQLWLKKNADIVTVEKKENAQSEGTPDLFPPAGMPPYYQPPAREPVPVTFYVFTLREATIWPRGVGFPNDASSPTIQQRSDVQVRGPVPTVTDVMHDIEETAAEAAARVREMASIGWRTVIIAAGIYWLATRSGNGRKSGW